MRSRRISLLLWRRINENRITMAGITIDNVREGIKMFQERGMKGISFEGDRVTSTVSTIFGDYEISFTKQELREAARQAFKKAYENE